MITIKTLLIIEDDLSFSSILSNILKKDYSIYLAFSLKQASQILMENKIDYICSDYNLTDGFGIEIIKFFKKCNKKIPVIIMTASLDNQITESTRSSGAISAIEKGDCDFLTKLKTHFPI